MAYTKVLEWTPSGTSARGELVCSVFVFLHFSITPRYNTAKKIKEEQDAYCVRVRNEDWEDLGDFPQDLKWEALVDVLRGRVKVR